MYYVGANRDGDQRLKKAMLVACVAHVALAFGISFNMPEHANSSARQIEVTLAMQPSAAAPLDARMLAQANQVGPDEENHFEPPPPPPQARAKPPETPTSTATLATRSNSRRIEDQLDTLCCCDGADDIKRVGGTLFKTESLVLEFNLPCIQLGEIENLINHV